MHPFKERKKEWIQKNPLRIWRLKNGCTQTDVGAAVGVGFHMIYSWEVGMASPNAKQVIDLSFLTNNKNLAKEWLQWIQERPELKEVKSGRKGVDRAVHQKR